VKVKKFCNHHFERGCEAREVHLLNAVDSSHTSLSCHPTAVTKIIGARYYHFWLDKKTTDRIICLHDFANYGTRSVPWR
jgi:hypothetical protein